MCCLRKVRNVYTRCGHGETLPDQFISCEQSNCRFSPFHPSSCKDAKCRQTCWQTKRFPEHYNPHIDALCPSCTRLAAQAARR